jgi:serine/threonine-protein kinase RsbW
MATGLDQRALSDSVAADQGIRLTIPARAEYVSLCRLALTGLSRVRDVSEETLADLKLALTEACSNSVRHAYPEGEGVVEITYAFASDRIVIEVRDNGLGFDPAHGAAADTDELTEGGLGIAIIRAVADEFELGAREDGRGSRLRFAKVLGG